MIEIKPEGLDLTSFSQLVQELIGGSVKRHTFSELELGLLLDLQRCKIRKNARPDLLRRYLRAVQQDPDPEAGGPVRLLEFIERENQQRKAVNAPRVPSRLAAAIQTHAAPA